MSVTVHTLGFPRIGAQRELKFALESFWRQESSVEDLLNLAKNLRQKHWLQQKAAGISRVAVGDFALYDHVLDTQCLFGALPVRFAMSPEALRLDDYFILARGDKTRTALEMTKWFDSNYHYLVPEFDENQTFSLHAEPLLAQIDEAKALGLSPKPVIIGPVTFLFLGKRKDGGDRLALLERLLPQYSALLEKLAAAGVEWVQLDEPILGLELDQAWFDAIERAYTTLQTPAVKILLATYFSGVTAHLPLLKRLPIAGVHLDGVRAPEQLQVFAQNWTDDKILSAGILDGRNIWRADLRKVFNVLQNLQAKLGERLWISTSCSLLHTPVDLAFETKLESDIKNYLAFAVQKLEELAVLAKGLNEGEAAIAHVLQASDFAQASRRNDPRIHNKEVRARCAAVTEFDARRHQAYAERAKVQKAALNLPILPTTTIGSFPQTADIRAARAAFKRGELSKQDYEQHMQDAIALCVQKQEALGIDVLVHGEAERNDMVEYFGELLAGFAFTQNGWVQSYGSRCVKPPVLFGDVYRKNDMTVAWSRFAQSLTNKPMKGMLTGPVTILQWSFVRDDQPRQDSCLAIALAIRDEVLALEQAGIAVIQIDEPAYREGLPLKKSEWQAYLDWASFAFRVSSSGISDATQIHTHMCYSEFNDILPAIAAMDADVITIETSRSDMELLDAFGEFAYPNEVGPGVYDIHSPRIPEVAEMVALLEKALKVLPAERLWVNPDCGLKTRTWAETEAALANMMAAVREVRAKL